MSSQRLRDTKEACAIWCFVHSMRLTMIGRPERSDFLTVPSQAQAQLIARLWGGPSHFVPATGPSDPNATKAACIRNGWLVSDGNLGHYPNGEAFSMYELSESALPALAAYITRRSHP